ncbi:MAG: permease-like cell division protein FtsX [Oscillospiraceae bacterium]|nr:permease-like cell division protein FtsX [Oscillospiraceae bacterium]
MKISSMNYLFRQGIKNIWTNRIMSVASFCILMVSLLLIGFTSLFIANINSFVGSIENKNEVILFLKDDVTDSDIEQIGVKLNNMDNISEVVFYSKEEAFEEIKKGIENSDELFSYVGEESPLPDSYRVKVEELDTMGSTLMEVRRLNGIDSINAPNDFVSILTDLKKIISIISAVILVSLIIVSLVIISNAERASVDIRKREIAIMKYVGATNAFIKIPFFVEGMTLGILAGGVAAVITIFGYSELASMLMGETTILTAMGISGLISLDEIMWPLVGAYVAIGALISAIGTVMCTRKYVKV